MARLEALLPGILARWGIAPHGVIAHSDMAPERKIDPGPRFDWRRLARQGLAVWPGPVPAGPGKALFRDLPSVSDRPPGKGKPRTGTLWQGAGGRGPRCVAGLIRAKSGARKRRLRDFPQAGCGPVRGRRGLRLDPCDHAR